MTISEGVTPPSWAADLLCDPATHEPLRWTFASVESGHAKYEILGGIPVFADSPESYQSRHSEWQAVNQNNGSVRAMEARRTIFDRLSGELAGGVVVDVCAGGVIVGCYLAAKYGCKVIAVEHSRRVLKEYGDLFMAYYNVSADQVFRVCADAGRLPLRSDAVDAVVGSSWVHHFEDKVAVLSEACRVLRARGIVIAHNEGLPGLLEGATSDEDRYVSPREYREAMARAGFEEVEVRGWSRLYGVARWLRGSVDLTGRRPSR
jgi:SAM-dependent methyltransferase